jgi:hypothetical protein
MLKLDLNNGKTIVVHDECVIHCHASIVYMLKLYKLGHLSQFQHHYVYVDDAFLHGNPKFPHCNINSIYDKHSESSLNDYAKFSPMPHTKKFNEKQ